MKNSKVPARQHLAKKGLENPLVWTLLIVVGVLIFGYVQLGWFGDRTSASEYLISVSAGSGAIVGQEDESGCFSLTLKNADHVVWFTDRPEREAWSTHITTLVDGWSEEFSSNPPNADLQLFRGDADLTVILTLKSAPVWDEDAQTLIFDKACPFQVVDDDQFESEDPTIITRIAGNTFSTAVLFIDGAKLFAWNSCYSPSDATGDKEERCVEQWGSYPLLCSTGLSSFHKAPGKRCKNICNRSNSDCSSGCYSNYQTGDSWNYYVSSYTCSN